MMYNDNTPDNKNSSFAKSNEKHHRHRKRRNHIEKMRISFFEEQSKECEKSQLADDYLELANSYIALGRYEKGKTFLLKAKELSPKKVISETLSRVNRLSQDTSHRVRHSLFKYNTQVESCLKGAAECLENGNREEAQAWISYVLKYYFPNQDNQHETQNFNERNSKPPLYIPRSSKIEMPPNVNKYEADRCMEIAAQHLANRDYDKTKRFLEKAKQLYPSKQVDEQLAALQRLLVQEKERKEKERKEKEKKEKERQEMERKEKERKEKEKKEKERQEKERQERYKKIRNEADQCILAAKSLMAQSKFDEAERMLLKAQKLCPDVGVIVRSLLEELNNLRLAEERRRQRGFETREEQKRKAYSEEDLRWVQKVLGCREDAHYDILQVSKSATFEEIRKVYKLLSLKLHPDKNRAPGATEAFKRMKKAYTVLSSGFSQSQQNAPPPKQDSQPKGSSANEKSGYRSWSGFANEEPKAKPKQGFANEEPKAKPKWGFANEKPGAEAKFSSPGKSPRVIVKYLWKGISIWILCACVTGFAAQFGGFNFAKPSPPPPPPTHSEILKNWVAFALKRIFLTKTH